jgi:predicted RNA-binding protein with PUA-like domain
MAGGWIVKTEPTAYAWDDLVRDGVAVWDGVRNAQALIHLRAMRTGDGVLIYHSGDQKALVGLARVKRGPYPDPAADDPKLVVVDLVPDRPLPRPVTLAAIKASGRFGDLGLLRQSRLSVMPVPATDWKALLKLADAA